MSARQFDPPHPGEVLWGLDMEPAGLSIKTVAERLGVDGKTISRIINGHAGVTAEMSILLGKAFNMTPDLWLNMQRNYDLWHAEQRIRKRVNKVKPFEHRLPPEEV